MILHLQQMTCNVIKKNLLEATEDFICQQNNCVGTKPHGLSKVIAERWPHADPYTRRRNMEGYTNKALIPDRPIPGTIEILKGRKNVICMYAQYGMGRPYSYNQTTVQDSAIVRKRWFNECLDEIAKVSPKITKVAMPYNIGCGLAGGNWELYSEMISRWAARTGIDVTLYSLV